MNGAYHVGATGLQALQRALDTVANNVANLHTSGFKRSEARFAEVIAARSATASDGLPAVRASDDLAGVRLDPLFMLDEQGEIQRTGRAFDLAVEGRGFIELMGPSGQVLLWRGGALRINEEGALAAASGLALRAGITVPRDARSIEIAADGVVRAIVADDAEAVEIGQIALVRIDDPAGVERLDGGLYRVAADVVLAEDMPGEDGAGTLVQGALERSNVELTDEMVRLMLVQRAYAANAQIVQAADQLMAIANGLRK